MASSLHVLADGFAFLEGPRWHEGRLWASDMHGDRVVAVDLDGRIETIIEMHQPSGLGWLPDGRLLVVSMVDRTVRRIEGGTAVLHADLTPFASFHANDMVVDADGRAYVGNFGYDFETGAPPVTTTLALVQPDGRASAAATDLAFPNGVVITPDGGTLIIAETFGHCLTAFDRAVDGCLSNRRVWADLGTIFPDGICLDAALGVWVASPMSNEVVRVTAGGTITDRIPASQHVIACALGGTDRRTLLLCTAPAIAAAAAQAKRGGRIESVAVEHAGAGWP